MSKSLPKNKNPHKPQGVIGIDEVGRGPLAGPITVCAVYLEERKAAEDMFFAGTIKDSKKIQKSLRNNIYETIRKNRKINSAIKYALSSCSSSYIDRHGITKAASVCVRSCLAKLRKQGILEEHMDVYLDAGLSAPRKYRKQKSFVKGDERFVEIALASIIAKEHRDAYMKKLSKAYPAYVWEKNAGYGTSEHRMAISTHGITKYHRKTYLKGIKLLDNAE